MTVALTGLRWPSLDAHRKYGGGSVADPVTAELRRLRTPLGTPLGVPGGGGRRRRGGRRARVQGRRRRDARRGETRDVAALVRSSERRRRAQIPDGRDARGDRRARVSRGGVRGAVPRRRRRRRVRQRSRGGGEQGVGARTREQAREAAPREGPRGVCAFRARDVGSRAVVEEALLAAKRDAVAAAARRREETAGGDGGGEGGARGVTLPVTLGRRRRRWSSVPSPSGFTTGDSRRGRRGRRSRKSPPGCERAVTSPRGCVCRSSSTSGTGRAAAGDEEEEG